MVNYHKLIAEAAKAKENAYVPYSQFRVGAAILADNGQIFTGCNIENSSFGLTVCAERTAVFKAVSAGYRNFQALAVSTDTEEITSPCGACRQVLNEFGEGIKVILANVHGDYQIFTVGELLPLGFKPEKLEEERLT